MRKILLVLLGLCLFQEFAHAAKVNVTKVGTPWVWRVEDGSNGTYILMEDGSYLITEASATVGVESSDISYYLMEDGGRLVFETGNGALIESAVNPGEGTMLYRALIGQGWEVTDLAATLPQAIQGTDAALAYGLLVMENGGHLLLENTNTIRLEN